VEELNIDITPDQLWLLCFIYRVWEACGADPGYSFIEFHWASEEELAERNAKY